MLVPFICAGHAMRTKIPKVDEVATIASELAEICRAGDLETLLCLIAMGACEAYVDRRPEPLLLQDLAPEAATPAIPAAEELGIVVAFQRGGAPRGFGGAPLGNAPAGL